MIIDTVTSLLYFFNDLGKPIKIYIYVRKNVPFTSYPAAKHSKHNKLAVTDILEKTVDFFNDTARAPTLAPAMILPT